jgi:hypothetical protein
MTKRVLVGVVLAILAGACASTQADYQPQTAAKSPDEVANGFRAAVVDVCVASAMGGTPVANLATETGPIVRSSDASGEGEVFTSRAAQSVIIRSSAGSCEVSTSGPSAKQTLEVVGQGLSDPHGFVLDPQVKGSGSQLLQRYTKKLGDKTLYVTLKGADTGSASQSSMLVATVTTTPPA